MKNILALIFTLLSFASLAQDSIETSGSQLLNQVRKDLSSLSADFSQYEIRNDNHHTEQSSGKVWLKAPNQFKWEYQHPAPQLIIADGKQVWIYDEDLEQVTIKPQNNEQNPIYILLNKQKLQDHYNVSEVMRLKFTDNQDLNLKEENNQWVELTPKVANEEIKSVTLVIRDNKLRSLKILNQMDNTVVFEFSEIKKNPQLTDDFFSFTPPKGTDIIQDTLLETN